MINSFATAATNCGDILVPLGNGTASPGQYTFTVTESGYIYLDVTNSSIEDVTVSINGKTKTFSDVNRGYLLDIGKCEAGTTVTLTTEQNEQSFTANAYRLDISQLNNCINRLNSQPFITDSYTDTSVSGRVNASEDGLLYMSIAYENGWTVKVDGEEVTPVQFADTMLAIPLAAGSHTIELSYEPESLRTGIIISLVSLILLAGLTLLKRRGRRRYPDGSDTTLFGGPEMPSPTARPAPGPFLQSAGERLRSSGPPDPQNSEQEEPDTLPEDKKDEKERKIP